VLTRPSKGKCRRRARRHRCRVVSRSHACAVARSASSAAAPSSRLAAVAAPRIAFEGSADALVNAIAAYEVRSIRSHDDDLEEIFLRYYKDDAPE
jgi:hypothetical protein